MAIPNIEDVQDPKVGRYYMVPCVKVYTPFLGNHITPIIGTPHADEDLGVAEEHYHYDVRFFYNWQLLHIRERGLSREEESMIAVRLIGKDRSDSTVIRVKRRMNRERPMFPCLSNGRPSKVARVLEPKYAEAKMAGDICPHRGMCLKAIKADEHGHKVCNGHGLKWDTKTGNMVRRVEL